MAELTDDQAHVALDGLNALRERIKKGSHPWAEYWSDPNEDPKASETGYRALIEQAQTALHDVLEGPKPAPPQAPSGQTDVQLDCPTCGSVTGLRVEANADVIRHVLHVADGMLVVTDEATTDEQEDEWRIRCADCDTEYGLAEFGATRWDTTAGAALAQTRQVKAGG